MSIEIPEIVLDKLWQGAFLSSYHPDGDQRFKLLNYGRSVVTESLARLPSPFQDRVQPWMMACFGEMIAGDREERNHRFIEEALELIQACGCSASEAHQLVDYVYGRPVGEKHQEVGGVMVTLAALCLANDLDMHVDGETELARVWTMVEKIRAKQAAKPKHSPLPVHVSQKPTAGLPQWFETFLTNVCEIPDRNSPEGEPDAIVATLDELRASALNAIESHSPAQFLFIAMDDDGAAHPTYCADQAAVKAAVRDAMFMAGEIDRDHQNQIDGVVESLLDSGAMIFEGDPSLYLYRLPA